MDRADLAARLRSALSSGRWSAGEKLPSVQTLAKHYHCSPVTLLAALRTLRAERLVSASPGSAYTVSAAQSPASASPGQAQAPSARLFAAETIAAALREDILCGSSLAVLPSAKELRKRFGCSHRTLVRALSQLQAGNLLQRHGSRYVTGGGAKGEAATHVYCLSDSRIVSGTVLSFVMGVEREMEAHGWGRLRFVTAADRGKKTPPLHQVAGYVHFQSGIVDEWSDVLRKPMPAPAAVVDLHEAGPAGAQARPNLYRIFPDNLGAGREVGRHLAALGHRRCAFFSYLTLAEGCGRLRLQGLTQVFPSVAGRGGRSCMVCDGSSLECPTVAAMGETNATLERLRAVVLAGSRLSGAFVRQSFDGAFGVVAWWSRYAGFRKLFQAALADRTITAWVCATDNLAMLAHTFLAENGLTPGRDVALAAFDNTWLSHGLGITSYDFGFDRMGRLAFYCLAAPQQVVRPGRTIVHAPGQLVTRASTDNQRL